MRQAVSLQRLIAGSTEPFVNRHTSCLHAGCY